MERKMENGDKIKITKIQLLDSSVFTIENKDFISALRMKLKVDDLTLDDFISMFIKKVGKHWKERTVPTKFPWDISWEEDIKGDLEYKLYNKFYEWKERKVKKTFGYNVKSIVPARWFEDEIKKEKARIIKEGIALKNNKLIIRNDTKEASIYHKISSEYHEIIAKKAEKEYEKNKNQLLKKFKDQASLAKEVFYQYVRPYLFGILLNKATKGKSGSIITSENSISLVKENTLVTKRINKGGLR